MALRVKNNRSEHIGSEGNMDVDDVKKQWMYLKDCYMKDRKKRNKYVASGSASTLRRKNTFRFIEAMSFLSDCMEPRPTSNTLPTNEDGLPPTSIEPVSPPPCVSTHSASVSLSPASIDRSTSSCSNISNVNSSKRKKSDSTKNDRDHLKEAFIAAVMSELAGKMDSVDHFVLRLAEGLRKLTYRKRAKLEIEFLCRIMEIQKRLDSEQSS